MRTGFRETSDPDEETGGQRCQNAFGNQEQVIRFLTSGAAFGGAGVERIETHISEVFLTGEFAYKLKRAVHLNFVDYSTLETRRIACEREVEINRKHAPEIYIGTVAVTKAGDSFALDGEGEIVDWLVKMNRFEERTLFSHLIAHNSLKNSLVSDLAEQVGRMHLGADRKPEFGGYAAVLSTIENVSEALEAVPGTVFAPGTVDAWTASIKDELLKQERRVDMRRRIGFVRQCHGDLHLNNICLVNGRPTPFDAIEFGEEFSAIDVLYDLAFPVMDLIHFGAPDLANLLLNRYLEVTCDYSGLRLLPLFLSLRAAVRAMVHALEAGKSSGRQAQALAYFELAQTVLVPQDPVLFAFGGLSGTGKSVLARKMASDLFGSAGAVVLRSDAIRKRIFRQPALVPLPVSAYSELVGQRVFREMCRDAHRALTAGWPVIVDATFIDRIKRNAIEAIADKKGVRFYGFWLEAEEDVLIARVSHRRGDVSDADDQVISMQLTKDHGVVDWNKIDASGSVLSSAEQVGRIVAQEKLLTSL